jgi:alpha-galactosidase
MVRHRWMWFVRATEIFTPKLLLASLLLCSAVVEGAQEPPAAAPPELKDYSAHILTPPAPDSPRINGASIFGVRPGNPFLFTIAATGRRPMTFTAENLPAGLILEAATGRITGRLTEPGEHRVTLIAHNALGKATRDLRIVVGDRLALTPPMGWNSWNAGGPYISDEKIRANAKAMVDTGLIHHGWQYINIDDAWQGARGGKYNAIQPNEKFPDMKALADYVHGLGLKIGIYSTPWVTSYATYVGGSSDSPSGTWDKSLDRDAKGQRVRKHGKYSFAWADARQWAEWGFDYLKYDWNPASNTAGPTASNDMEYLRAMSDALRYSGRDIVYSYSNSAPFSHVDEMAVHTNAWRTTGDIRDNWQSMSTKGFDKDEWAPFAGPGHWNDPDMLVVGLVGWQGKLANTTLTPDEQYTHISLWSLVSSPLLIGCDMSRLDPFTISLLSNDEVLAVNQDPLGEQAITVSRVENPEDPGPEITTDSRGREQRTPKGLEVLAKNMEDGSMAAGLFNRSAKRATVTLRWADLGTARTRRDRSATFEGRWRVRDLWRQKDLGEFEGEFSAEVNPHGVVMVQLFRTPPTGTAAPR